MNVNVKRMCVCLMRHAVRCSFCCVPIRVLLKYSAMTSAAATTTTTTKVYNFHKTRKLARSAVRFATRMTWHGMLAEPCSSVAAADVVVVVVVVGRTSQSSSVLQTDVCAGADV